MTAERSRDEARQGLDDRVCSPPPIKVTPEMIEAGVQAYYKNACGGWENPGGDELRNALREIYEAMARCAPIAYLFA